jgi:D-serine deaminase-like pyridoxal phosphate-dependent protein
MKKSTVLFGICLAAAAQFAVADEAPAPLPPAVNEARAACEADVQKLCAGVQPGGGRILACLKEHKDAVSDGCKQALAKVKRTPS